MLFRAVAGPGSAYSLRDAARVDPCLLLLVSYRPLAHG